MDLDHFKAVNDARGHAVGAARLGELPYVRTPERWLELADARLYRAKAAGRDAICVSDEVTSERE